jgi:PST family polysaccharide transporter
MSGDFGVDNKTMEMDLSAVKTRAVKGVFVLTIRTFLINAISFLAQGLLWLFITPQEFGVFLMVSSVINFLSYFADIGLGAALIQKKEKPLDRDYFTVFAIQESLVLSVVTIIFVVSPFLTRYFSLDNNSRLLLYALNLSFLLASFKNIPSIILERRLEFSKFVIPQVLETLVYNISLTFFAWKGFGISSFTYSVVLRGVVGVLAIYYIQPWVPKFSFSRSSLKELLKFGIPYQLNNFLATLKDDGVTIALGGILGHYGLGILGTAQKLSQYPLRFFMDNVNKVAFPTFSRMQDDRDVLSRSVTRVIFFVCLLVYPSLVGLMAIFPVFIDAIPRYQKWEPAYLPLFFLSLGSLISATTTQLTNLFASLGEMKINLKLMIMWLILTWVFVPTFSLLRGVNGAAFAYLLVGLSSFVSFFISRRFVKIDLYYSVLKPLFASLVMGFFLYVLRSFFPATLLGLLALILFGALVYGLVIYLLVGKDLVYDVKKGLATILGQKGL